MNTEEQIMDFAFGKISKNMKVSDVKNKKKRCVKCGYPVTLMGSVLLCQRCCHAEEFV